MNLLDQPNAPLTIDNPRGGINVHFNLTGDIALQQSPAWIVAGRTLRFIHLAPDQSLSLPPGNHYTKVILGELANVNMSCLTAPFAVRSTRLDVRELVSGGQDALFALMHLADDAPEKITDMSALTFSGPHSDRLVWQRFDEKFAGIIDFFDGKDCFMANGLHVLNEHGVELVYVNPWTCGKGVDLSTHNHAHPPSAMAPAFAEVHWVLAAGTASSGMYETPEPGSPERTRHPMGLGDEHGPFYDRDAEGRPMLRENGAVQYPWHGWQGGEDDQPGQAYDFVVAFEINPDFIEARI